MKGKKRYVLFKQRNPRETDTNAAAPAGQKPRNVTSETNVTTTFVGLTSAW